MTTTINQSWALAQSKSPQQYPTLIISAVTRFFGQDSMCNYVKIN